MYKSISLIVGVILLLFSAQINTSCAGSSVQQGQVEACDSCIDTMLSDMMDENPELAMAAIDSLEAAHAVSQKRICCYRAKLYYKMGDKPNEILWREKALEGDSLYEENPELFYKMSDKLFTVLVNQGEVEKGLAVAQRGYDAAKEDQSTDGMHWMAILLHGIGYCQMQLGNIDEAERCFSQAYIALKQMAAANDSLYTLRTCARVSYNIVDAYNSTGQYDKAEAWIESAEDAINQMAASPECSKALKDDFQGGLAVQKALVLLQKGRRAEADRAYNTAIDLEYTNTSNGVLECATYLERAKRMDDLMALMPKIDSISNAWGNPASLAHWKQYQIKQNM